jgi:hypothetical protein
VKLSGSNAISKMHGKCGHSKARWQECKSREGTISAWDEMQFDECRSIPRKGYSVIMEDE